MQSKKPLVSILMNCFNGERFLHEALQSVLNQSYSNWELIFWDNKSTDSSKSILESFKDKRFKYFSANKKTSLGYARAEAYKFLSGEFITVLDVDDIWLAEKLECQLKLFSDPEVGIVISDTIFFNENSQRLLYGDKFPREGYVFRDLLKNYNISLETIMIRKSFVSKLDIKGFDQDFSYIADYDLILRVAKISKLMVCKKVLAKWRVHESSDTWKSLISFPLEKENWIKKQSIADQNFRIEYSSELTQLNDRNYILIAFYKIAASDKVSAIKFLSKIVMFNRYKLGLWLLILIPYSKLIVRVIIKRRLKRLLK